MNTFLSNSFLTSSTKILFALIFVTVVLHLMLVWPKNRLSKTGWKAIDYVWLAVATLGLLSLASDVRRDVASNWLKLEKNWLDVLFVSTDIVFKEPAQHYICKLAVSIDDEQLSKEYESACQWRKDVQIVLDDLRAKEAPTISMSSFPIVTFTDPILIEEVRWLEARVEDYKKLIPYYIETKTIASRTKFEHLLAYYAPFFLCFALAIRITKVTGEMRLEA